MAKVLVGMSGGVDSSAAAAKLLEDGHEIVGGYMKNWINSDGIPGDCPWEQDVEDAYRVAQKLGVEFRVIDLIDQYQKRIVNYLLDGYRDGITPNPDVYCNREMKFGVFLDYALEQGFQYVATGHYAIRRENFNGNVDILKGGDPNKEQSYFLSMMHQRQARHAFFPIGHMLKSDVRALAEKYGLHTAQKKDSQGICFIGNVKMSDFLKNYVPDKQGDIVDLSGKKRGRHDGLHLYTLGQRKGHGVASPKEGVAFVVVGKDFEKNQLILGYEGENTKGLYASTCVIGSVNWVNKVMETEVRVQAKPRYRTECTDVIIRPLPSNKLEVEFLVPQRALTPGQICALYDGDVLLGGGVFEQIGNNV